MLRRKGILSVTTISPYAGTVASFHQQPLSIESQKYYLRKMEEEPFSRRNFCNSTPFSMRKRDEDFYGVPHAYKKHREHRDRDKGIGKGRIKGKGKRGARHGLRITIARKESSATVAGNSSFRQSNGAVNMMDSDTKLERHSNTFGAEEKPKDPEDVIRAQKQVEKLMRIEDEVKALMETYQKALGTTILVYDNETGKSNDTNKSSISASTLIDTEDLFRQLCIKQRQLVAGWSWMRPLQRNRLWKWSEDAKSNTLPPDLAMDALKKLESLRQRRAVLIKSSILAGDEVANTGSKMFEWVSKNVFGLSEDQKQPISVKALSDLNAHTSPDFTASARLYHGILNSYDWWQGLISKQMLPKYLEDVLVSMSYNFTNGNPNVKPDTKAYSHLIMCYQHSNQLDDAKKSAKVLDSMLDSTRQDFENDLELVCRPTPTTFDHVLSAFYHSALHAQDNDNDAVLTALKEAEKVLTLMEHQEAYLGEGTLDHGSAHESEELKPYHTMLKLYRVISPSLLTDYQEKIDDLMVRMIGKDLYENLLRSDGGTVPPEFSHHILQDLVHSFASARDRECLDKAKVLLEKMGKTRSAALQKDPNFTSWNPKFPFSSSYNSVIMGCVLYGDDVISRSIKLKKPVSKERKLLYQDAIYAMRLLDSMLGSESSLPQLHTYSRLVRLLSNSMSRNAGKRAEEVLSRMEVQRAFSMDMRSIKDVDLGVKIKQAALECWAVSAAAGLPRAAMSASLLFHRLDERLNQELGGNPERRQAKIFFYNAVIKACSETTLQNEKVEALEIAFDMYNRICADEIAPTSLTFVLLLKCCQLLPPSSQDRVMKLSKEIFGEACSNGRVSRHVLFMLRRVNNSLVSFMSLIYCLICV